MPFRRVVMLKEPVKDTEKQWNQCFLPVLPICFAAAYFLLKYGLRLGELLTADGRPGGTKRKETIRKTNKWNKWRRQLFLSPRILPITGLGFQPI